MKSIRLLIVLGLLVITLGCSTISVQHDYDPKADFTSLKTFSFMPVPAKANINTLNVKRIQDAVRTQLESRGYTMTPNNPDFQISMHLTKLKQKVEIVDRGYTYGAQYGLYASSLRTGPTREYQYEEGTFVLDFVDAQSKELIWRGVAMGEIRYYLSPEKRVKRINEAAQKILKNFPPTEKY
jgi:hypothetical protein